ncbi:MAG: bacteriocin family protein [Anaerolineales bacterium]|nr:bacteriocin family protein [Anaerolineales bacterium]
MADYLMRDDAPFSAEEWARVDELVVSTARNLLVGRRFISLTGPLGAGTEVVPIDTISVTPACLHNEAGCNCASGECDVIEVSTRRFVPVPMIHKDFRLEWRHVAAGRQGGMPLELGPAAAAAAACARAEDQLIFQDLLNAEGSHSVELGDWDEPGAAFAAVVGAIETLVANGSFGPFAVVLSPALYAKTQRVSRGMGRLESKLIDDVAKGGMHRSPVLTGNQGMVVAQGAHNLDIAVAQDLVTAYLGPEGLDHMFRVMESLVLRIKRPGAIAVFK